jgi:Trk-type K+ transport system membrane component
LILTFITLFFLYFLESNNTLQHSSPLTAFFDSLFQSIATRSCGMNSINIGNLTSPSIILLVLMMFIGGNSGSTAGGIKTSTFTLMILSAASTISGKKNIELSRQSISFELINRAFSIFLFMSGFIFMGVFILSITDAHVPLVNIVFEMVSATGNVGLSTGITSKMSEAGKVVLIIGMFVGRVGILTLAFALSKKVISSNYRYPKTHIMIG